MKLSVFTYKWFFLLFSINFFINLGFGMSDHFFFIYYKELGADGILIGVCAASYQFTKVIISPVAGKVSDRLDNKKVMIYCLILYLVIAVLYLSIKNMYSLVIMRILQGISCAGLRTVLYSILNAKIPEQNKGKFIGTFDISFYFAITVGLLAGGWLKDHYGFQGIFICLTVMCLVALLLGVLFLFTKNIKSDNKPDKYAHAEFKSSVADTSLSLFIFIFGKAITVACFTILFPIYLIVDQCFTAFETGVIIAVSTIGMCLFLKPMGYLADIYPKHSLVLIGGIFISMIFFFIPSTLTFQKAVVFVFSYSFFGAASQPSVVALLMESTSKVNFGEVMGRFNSVMGIGFAFGALVCSVIMKFSSIQMAFISAGILSFMTSCAFYMIFKKQRGIKLLNGFNFTLNNKIP